MCNEEETIDFYKGEFRKIYMDVMTDCDDGCCDTCEDFVIENPTARLLKNGKEIELPSKLDDSGKRLIIDVDCENLSGFYKLVVDYDLNEQTRFAVADVRVKKIRANIKLEVFRSNRQLQLVNASLFQLQSSTGNILKTV